MGGFEGSSMACAMSPRPKCAIRSRGFMDLNCDLGEDEPWHRTHALMRWITSANIACGVHAGSDQRITQCLEWARKFRVRAGAHPGMAGAFGRQATGITPKQLSELIVSQVGHLESIASPLGMRLHHVKL